TIAPNVGGWSSGKYTFNGSLCESARTTTLGRKEEAPLAPPVTQVQTRADEIKENASEDITTECIPKAQAEERCKNAETKIGKPPGNIAKVELVNKDSAGAACPTDTARCVVIDKEGLKCDSLYGKPSMKAIGCACGSDNISTAVKGDSPASPKKTTIDGVEVSYFCCQCAPNTSLSNPDCGQNMNSESDFGKQSYKCCEQQSSNLKLCRNGTKMFTDSGECYCVIGENGSVCSPSSGEGCRKGLECKLVSELYNQEQCEECKGKSGWDWAWCVKNCASARILGGAEAKWKGFMSDTFKVTALGQCACPSGTSDCLRDLGGH
ncbi:hypothetical protein HYW94_00440, partial [Candidatus Uhrbacteria bacterium]|nr:hypothetical protein [Candidatus Uhrbacteria bacterium]